MQLDDTIVALSSPPAPSPRIILRIDGPAALSLAQNLSPELALRGPKPSRPSLPFAATPSASRHLITFDNLHFPAHILRFISPNSYTGNDLVEFHLPGNPLLAKLLLDHLLTQGARLAEPGEFTARAYFSGKLDLTQAEGVAAAVAAQSRRQLHAARQLLAGELARRLQNPMELLADLLALLEAGIDFSEEEISFVTPQKLLRGIDEVSQILTTLLEESPRLESLAHEPTLVLAGRPNAGKSTLLNALCAQPRAIVSTQPGTTRDVLSATLKLPRGTARLLDIAGLDETTPTTEIESQMRDRALRAIQEADILILLRDITDPRPDLPLPRPPDLKILSKSDLLPNPHKAHGTAVGSLPISSTTKNNLNELLTLLDHQTFGPTTPDPKLALAARHRHSLAAALTSLTQARHHSQAENPPPEFIAADLRDALDHLGQIIGDVTPDDILGKIFSSFCIGK